MYKISDAYNEIAVPVQNIRHTNLFLELEAIISNHDDGLPKGDWEIKTRVDYNKAKQMCLEILSLQSKDLQVAAWLLQIAISEGKGIFESVSVLHYIIDNHFDTQNNDFIQKACANLNKFLMIQLRKTILVQGDAKFGYKTLHDVNSDIMLELDDKTKDDQKQWINGLYELFKKIENKLDNAKLFSAKKILDEYLAISKKSDVKFESHVEDELSGDVSVNIMKIHSREEAYQLIKEVMTYLKVHDPHSATPYLLQKACEWEKKSFVDILNEFNDPVIIEKLFKPES